MTTTDKKDKEKRIAFMGDWINKPWTSEEKAERVKFYAERGVKLEFGDKLVENE